MHCVSHYLLAIRFDGDGKLRRLSIHLSGWLRLLGQRPVRPAIQMLDDSNICRLLLVIADSNLKSLFHPVVAGINMETGTLAFADYVKRIPGVRADGLIFRRVIDLVFADAFQVSICIPTVEA